MKDNDEIREVLNEIFCGDEEILDEIVLFEDPDYATAVIGISDDHSIIYDYDLMIEHLMNEEGMSEEDAADFVNYDTIRALGYFNVGIKPTIKYNLLF